MGRKIPATIVTGFLGAGKTTLIRHLIGSLEGRRLALIVNEFGEMGFDGELLKGCAGESCRAEDIVELANGCLCCTVADDFLPALRALLARPEPPDHIVIETSGLALPKPLVKAFDWPEARARLTVDGVITVLDGAAVLDGRFAADPAALAAQRSADPALAHDDPLEELHRDQLACADLVVVSKADLLGEGGIEAVKDEIAGHLRPGVGVVPARFGALPARLLLGLEAAAEDDVAERRSVHDGEPDHDHDDFDSFRLTLPPVADPAALVGRLIAAARRHGLLRVKGFAAVEDRPARLVVQGVGERFTTYFDRPWAGEEARQGRLAVIGFKGLDRAAIAAAVAGEG